MAQTYNLTIAALIFLVGTAGLISGASADDVETTNAQQESADTLDDSDEERYNCMTREVWSEEKQAWCDAHFSIDPIDPDFEYDDGGYEVVICTLPPEVEEKTTLEKAGDAVFSIVEGIGSVIADLFDFDSYNIYRSTNQTNSLEDGSDSGEDGESQLMAYDSYNVYKSVQFIKVDAGLMPLDYDSYNIYRSTNQTNSVGFIGDGGAASQTTDIDFPA